MVQRMIIDRRGRVWGVHGMPAAGPDGPHPVPRIRFQEVETGELRVCPAPRMPEEMSDTELLDRLHLLAAGERTPPSRRRVHSPPASGGG